MGEMNKACYFIYLKATSLNNCLVNNIKSWGLVSSAGDRFQSSLGQPLYNLSSMVCDGVRIEWCWGRGDCFLIDRSVKIVGCEVPCFLCNNELVLVRGQRADNQGN